MLLAVADKVQENINPLKLASNFKYDVYTANFE
jgi:hypothetical protein